MALEVVNINQVEVGDILLFDGFELENEVLVITVQKVTDEGLIVAKELGGLDICPEDMDRIVRLGTIKEEPVLHLLAEKMSLGLSKEWQKRL